RQRLGRGLGGRRRRSPRIRRRAWRRTAARNGNALWRQPGHVRANRQLQERPGARAGDPRTARPMSFSAYTISAAPLIPWWAIAALAGVAVLVLALGLWRRARGLAWRGAAIAILL